MGSDGMQRLRPPGPPSGPPPPVRRPLPEGCSEQGTLFPGEDGFPGGGRLPRCPRCGGEAELVRRGDNGQHVFFAPHELPAHLVPARLRWTVDHTGAATPAAPNAAGPVRVHHGDLCPAGSGPLARGLLALSMRPRPMAPGPPEPPMALKPLPSVPVPAEYLHRSQVVARYPCPACGAVPSMPCTTPVGRFRKRPHPDRRP